ncbi:hypothetical protein GCM10010412_064150 [Nonomuraea recticatena]|uniref:Glycoside hydrolase 35 catalytic domain-containing protein n=1 Tax=Nonomuraea recticatena TaxID=46178 RepID=A0ABP6F390_9ACTN
MGVFSYDNGSFRLDDAEFRVLSGALHYFRVRPEQWGHRLAMLRTHGAQHRGDVRAVEPARAPPGRLPPDGGTERVPGRGRGRRAAGHRAARTVHLRRVGQRRAALLAHRPPAHRDAYVACVLEGLFRALQVRDVFATPSLRWADPRAHLLDGKAWEAISEDVLASLSLTDPVEAHLDTKLLAWMRRGGRWRAGSRKPGTMPWSGWSPRRTGTPVCRWRSSARLAKARR